MATGPDRRVLVLGIAIPLVALVVVLVVTFGGGSEAPPRDETATGTAVPASPEPAVDDEWNAELAEVLEPLQGALPTYVARVEAWASGSLPADQLAPTLEEVAGVLADVDGAVRSLRPHPQDELAGALIGDSLGLYRHAVRAHQAAIAMDDADLAVQYDRLGRRLRILGDRIFDRARERTAAAIDPGEDIRLVLPAEVPDWSGLELGAGPPLDRSSDRTDELPASREDDRATQPGDRWLAAVDALDVPTVDDVRGALGSPERLAALARELVAAAEALRTVPVPDGDRGRADRLALGWLVRADAARAGQLDAITGADDPLADRLLELASGPELSRA